MKEYRTNQVFIPGGIPQFTYVERAERKIVENIEETKDHLCKIVTLTGQTKSGKSVMAQKVFPDTEPENVWIEGGITNEEDDLWSQIVSKLGVWTEQSEGENKGTTSKISGEIGGEANAFLAKGQAKTGTGLDHSRTNKRSRGRTLSAKTVALENLPKSASALIIDDFHYLPRDTQGSVVRALKPLIFRGFPVVLIAIPHRRFDAIKVERELTGRVFNIEVPYWDTDELEEISNLGFPLLNVEVDKDVLNQFTSEAFGSPHLMQEFCRQLCRDKGIKQTDKNKVSIEEMPTGLFERVAEGTGRTVFEKLAQGPRQRSDRIQRQLRSGMSVDIYKLVLLALANLKPGMSAIQYEDLRGAIRDLVSEALPQAHEISRVLDKMSEIASSDEASTPVIDWQQPDQLLHVTDPFFAFFMRWGVNEEITSQWS